MTALLTRGLPRSTDFTEPAVAPVPAARGTEDDALPFGFHFFTKPYLSDDVIVDLRYDYDLQMAVAENGVPMMKGTKLGTTQTYYQTNLDGCVVRDGPFLDIVTD